MPDNDVERQEAPITRDEMVELFGEAMPIEAANVLFDAPESWTIGQVRAEVRRIAGQVGEKPVGVEAIADIVQREANDGADSPVDRGDAEQIARAILATLFPPPRDAMRGALEKIRDRADSGFEPDGGAAARIEWIEAELDDEPYRPVYALGEDREICRNGHEVMDLIVEYVGLVARTALNPEGPEEKA